MTIQAKAERIIKDIKKEKGNNPIQIFKRIAEELQIMIISIFMDQNIIF